MKLGLQVPNFTWAGGPERLGVTLGDIVAAAEEAGFESIWVMDHFFQIQFVGPPEMEMLESYTTLGYIAARTSRVGLGTMVTGVTYRHPGILAKQVTTLDVLSGGRAMLGIGAAWYEQEHRGLGVPYPPLKERFERLEETIQVCLAMWRDGDAPYEGKHYRLERTLNSPQVLSKPHPPILIGGSGERKTLKLVARYADACNLFPTRGRLATSSRCSAATARMKAGTTRRSRKPQWRTSTPAAPRPPSGRSASCACSPAMTSRRRSDLSAASMTWRTSAGWGRR